MGKWIKKLSGVPLTNVAKVIDSLVTSTNIHTNAPSINAVNNALGEVWETVYPVGSIYMNVNNVDPSVLFGGTWVQLKDRFLLGAGDTYTNGATGGAATHNYTPSGTVGGHALTDKEIAPHDHGYYRTSYTYPNESTYHLNNDAQHAYFDFSAHDHTGNMYAGDGTVITEAQAHTHPFTGTQGSINTMPPYLVVNVWKRTA